MQMWIEPEHVSLDVQDAWRGRRRGRCKDVAGVDSMLRSLAGDNRKVVSEILRVC